MSRVTTAVVLFTGLALTAGCAQPPLIKGAASTGPGVGSTPTSTATTPAPNPSASLLDGESALQIWTEAQTAARAAKTVHVVARMADGKDKLSVDLGLAHGGDVGGTIALNGQRMTLERHNGVTYLKTGPGFWQVFYAGNVPAQKFTNHWVRWTKDDRSLKGIIELLDMDYWVKNSTVGLDKKTRKNLRVIAGKEIGGEQTVGLADHAVGQDTASTGTMYVSIASGLPMTLLVGTDSSQYLKYRDWNAGVDFEAPQESYDLDPYLAGPATS